MMRIKAITPIRVHDDELARRQERYHRLSPSGIAIVLVNLPDDDGVPRALESDADLVNSDRYVAEEALRTDPSEYDAVLPDCVLDPGVPTIERGGPLPVFGILKLSGGYMRAAGRPFAAVARNRVIASELKRCIERYGLAEDFSEVHVLDLAFRDIADHDKWNAALTPIREALAPGSVHAILNGCSAVDVAHDELPVSVFDPMRLALQLIAIGVAQGILPEREPQLTNV